jgi:uncharacterized protein YegP (UPF0339 family)
VNAPRFEIRKAKLRRRWYVVLIASNGEVLCTSELLNSKAAARTNIAATVIDARHAAILDTSDA